MSPRPARFTRTEAVDAAFEIVDAGGVEQLTMRRLSAALGVDPMALYRVFAHKSDVVAALAERFWVHLELPEVGHSAGWRDYASALMFRIRSSLSANPNIIPVIATHPITAPAALAVADEAIGRLLSAGAPEEPALVDLVNTLVMLTVASALGEYSPPAGTDATTPVDTAEEDAQAAAGLAGLPHLGRLVRSGWMPSQHRQFETALQAVLTGWTWEVR